ncbi:MAG: hypothetical protein KDD40_11075, partial [Bdellovibrionales bacterium]|nr:hypothetical protein [Bdellovibrionales bacterium]
AGSLATNISPESREDIFNAYAKTQGQLPENLIVSSSVMDYFSFMDGYMLGHQIELGSIENFSYDQKAIDIVYLGKKHNIIPYSCSHVDTNKYIDCKTFDYGKSFVEYVAFQIPIELKALPFRLYQSYLSAKAPLESDKTFPLHLVSPNDALSTHSESDLVDRMFSIRKRLIWAFKDYGKMLVPRQDAFNIPPLDIKSNRQMFRQLELKYLAAEIERVSKLIVKSRDLKFWQEIGLSISSIPQLETLIPRVNGFSYTQWAQERFYSLLINNVVNINSDQKNISFNQTEVDEIKELTNGFFQSLARNIHEYDINEIFKQIHDSPGKIIPQYKDDAVTIASDDITEQLAEVILNRITEYAFSPEIPEDFSEESSYLFKIKLPNTDSSVETVIPQFKYHYNIRLSAINLLHVGLYPGGREYPFWGRLQKNKLRKIFDTKFLLWNQTRRAWRTFINEQEWDAPEYRLIESILPIDKFSDDDRSMFFNWFKEVQELCLSITEKNSNCWW